MTSSNMDAARHMRLLALEIAKSLQDALDWPQNLSFEVLEVVAEDATRLAEIANETFNAACEADTDSTSR